MIHALIGKKIDQSQMFLENGHRVPVTEVSVEDNAVVGIRTIDNNSYSAVQLGYGQRKKAVRSLVGTAKKAGFEKAPVVLKEIRMAADDAELPTIGAYVAVDTVFKAGDKVAVTGTSKGKGFAGVVKRHGFRGGPKTHGQSDRHRAPGSIGQTTTPGRVYRGKRMAGHMGTDTVTLKNLTVVSVDAANKKLYIAGLVPGHKNAVLFITKEGEQKNFVPLLHPYEKVAEEIVEPATEADSNVVENEEAKATSTSNVAETDVADVENKEEKHAAEQATKEEVKEKVSSEEKTEDVKVEEPEGEAKTADGESKE
jgi:large subunit ribosomal protein L3